MINNRPPFLNTAKYYKNIPTDYPLTIDFSDLPTVLNFDMLTLFGILPVTTDLIKTVPPRMGANPTKEEIDYYKTFDPEFQIIQVVANFHSIIIKDGIAYGKPYAISIVPGLKRGFPDRCKIGLLEKLDLDKVLSDPKIYTHFNPFDGVYDGFYGSSGFFLGGNRSSEHFTDSIGFIVETYFLNTIFEENNVLLPGYPSKNEKLENKYRKLRIKKYFTPFSDSQPRKIWGADSPIELFLIQGLGIRNLFPVIQTSVYKDGTTYPNFYEMIKEDTYISGIDLITDLDMYFPNEKVAIFCDSKKFHRSQSSKEKDNRITERLEKLGISSIRLSGIDIISNLEKCLDKIETELKIQK